MRHLLLACAERLVYRLSLRQRHAALDGLAVSHPELAADLRRIYLPEGR